MNRLEGKVAVVTGANSGVGAAIAKLFAAEGATVVMTARREAALEEVSAQIEEAGGKTFVMATDISKPDDPERLMAAVEEKYGKIDVLVNNAGILSLKKPFVEYTKADWDKIFGINFMGDVFFCKAVIPTMKEKKAGRIINMASQSAETGGLAASPIYAASKAAVWCMTKSLAGEMGPYQVTVNAVAPPGYP